MSLSECSSCWRPLKVGLLLVLLLCVSGDVEIERPWVDNVYRSTIEWTPPPPPSHPQSEKGTLENFNSGHAALSCIFLSHSCLAVGYALKYVSLMSMRNIAVCSLSFTPAVEIVFGTYIHVCFGMAPFHSRTHSTIFVFFFLSCCR